MAHHKHANKQGKRHQGDKDKRGGPHLYHDRRLALVSRSLVALFLGLAGDRTHIECRIVGTVTPCLAHVNNLVRIERLAVVPRRDLDRSPALTIQIHLGPGMGIGSRQVKRAAGMICAGDPFVRSPIPLDIARRNPLRPKRKRCHRGKIGRIALMGRTQKPLGERPGFGICRRSIRITCKRRKHGTHTANDRRLRYIRVRIPAIAREQVLLDCAALVIVDIQIVLANK